MPSQKACLLTVAAPVKAAGPSTHPELSQLLYEFGQFYRLGTLNSNTVNSKFHLIRSFFEIFARFLSFHV